MVRSWFGTEGIPDHLDGDPNASNHDDKNLSRLEFIKAAALSFGSLFLAGSAAANEVMHYLDRDPIFKIEFDDKERVSFDEAAALAIRFDRALDRLPIPEFANTQQELTEFALELVPQFEYEGVVSKATFPEEVEFTYFPDAGSANHVLGRSDCSTFAHLNLRMAFETSTWGDTEVLYTIAHELAHVQQGTAVCLSVADWLVENSAQIASMEVMCGLANQGNPIYLWAAVNELRGMFLSSALGLAYKEDRMNDFEILREQLSPGAFAEARFQKSHRRWSDDPLRRAEILDWYNVVPINQIVWAIRENNKALPGLAFPEIDTSSTSGYYGTTESLTLMLDDTAWVIEHLEELVDWSATNFPHP